MHTSFNISCSASKCKDLFVPGLFFPGHPCSNDFMTKKTSRRSSAPPPVVGAHVSIAGGIWNAIERGEESGCTALQIFTKNASQWQAPPLADEAAARFRDLWEASAIGPVIAHDAYLINLASPAAVLRNKSRKAFLDEMERAEKLRIPFLVTHPGAHTGSGVDRGLAQVAASLDWVHERTEGFALKVCLENTAGQGTVLGGDFGHLGEILSRVGDPGRVAVCLDTCHSFAAGYDLRHAEGYEKAMTALEGAVGRGRVAVIHANDAKGELGGHLDRHEHIGRGGIGLEGFRLIMSDERFRHCPKILETPKEDDGLPMDLVNLAVLRALEGKKRVPPRLLDRATAAVRAGGAA